MATSKINILSCLEQSWNQMQNERTNVIDLNLRLFIVRIAPKTFAKIMQCVSFTPSHIFDI